MNTSLVCWCIVYSIKLLWGSFFANNTLPQFTRECVLFLFLLFPLPGFEFTDIGNSSLNPNRNFNFNLRLWLFKINLVLVELASAFFEIAIASSVMFRLILPSCDSFFAAALPLCLAKDCPIRVFSRQSLLFNRTHWICSVVWPFFLLRNNISSFLRLQVLGPIFCTPSCSSLTTISLKFDLQGWIFHLKWPQTTLHSQHWTIKTFWSTLSSFFHLPYCPKYYF
jgi:hypothetical protein